MAARPFLDTNVLIYAFTSGDVRHEQAASLVESGGVVSVQVLNEFANVARRKLGRDWNEIKQGLDDLGRLLDDPLPLTLDLHRDGLDIARRYGCQLYDALILAAARKAGCQVLLTEDMQDGQTIDGVVIRNPFVGAGSA